MLDITVEAFCGVALTFDQNEPRGRSVVVVDTGFLLLPVDNLLFIVVVFEAGRGKSALLLRPQQLESFM